MNRKQQRGDFPNSEGVEHEYNEAAISITLKRLFMFNSFGVGETVLSFFLFMFNPFRIVRLKKDVGTGFQARVRLLKRLKNDTYEKINRP
jgi:hypothetical protein